MSKAILQFEQGDSEARAREPMPVRLARRLRSPTLGLSGEMVRFAIAGGVVAVVYLGSTTILAHGVGLPFEVALILGYLLGMTVHFALQRAFVWIHPEGFALKVHHQLGRYLCVAGALYGTTALATGLLPGPLDLPTEVVYLATAIIVTGVNFLVLRHRIFHGPSAQA